MSAIRNAWKKTVFGWKHLNAQVLQDIETAAGHFRIEAAGALDLRMKTYATVQIERHNRLIDVAVAIHDCGISTPKPPAPLSKAEAFPEWAAVREAKFAAWRAQRLLDMAVVE